LTLLVSEGDYNALKYVLPTRKRSGQIEVKPCPTPNQRKWRLLLVQDTLGKGESRSGRNRASVPR